jgi:hypothetical protein
MVEDVKEFGAELEPESVSKKQLSPNSEIVLPGAEATQRVPPQVPLLSGRRHAKGSGVKALSSRTSLVGTQRSRRLKNRGALRSVEIEGLARH